MVKKVRCQKCNKVLYNPTKYGVCSDCGSNTKEKYLEKLKNKVVEIETLEGIEKRKVDFEAIKKDYCEKCRFYKGEFEDGKIPPCISVDRYDLNYCQSFEGEAQI